MDDDATPGEDTGRTEEGDGPRRARGFPEPPPPGAHHPGGSTSPAEAPPAGSARPAADAPPPAQASPPGGVAVEGAAATVRRNLPPPGGRVTSSAGSRGNGAPFVPGAGDRGVAGGAGPGEVTPPAPNSIAEGHTVPAPPPRSPGPAGAHPATNRGPAAPAGPTYFHGADRSGTGDPGDGGAAPSLGPPVARPGPAVLDPGHGAKPVLAPLGESGSPGAVGFAGVDDAEALPPLVLPPLRDAPLPVSATAARSRSPRRGLMVAGIVTAAVVVAAGLFALGAALFHRSRSGGSATPSPVATLAAEAWLGATPYRGPAVADLPAGLGRSGALRGTLTPAASWRNPASSGEVFVVAAAGRQPFGLAVTLVGGRVSLPPTITPVPWTSGAVPPPTGTRAPGGSAVPPTVTSWAASTFGTASAAGSLTPALGLGATGAPTVLGGWVPHAGGTVYRVQVTLRSDAPGTPTGTAHTNAQSVANAQQAVTKAGAALNSAKSNYAKATHKLATDQSAANPPAAPTVPGAAPPATTVPSAAVQAARAALGPDTAAVHAAERAQADAQKAYGAAQQKLQAAQAAKAAGPPAAAVVTAVGTYDLWVAEGKVQGWGPAGFSR